LAFEVPEPLIRQVRPWLEVRVRHDAFPGEETEAKVGRVSGALDPATRSMRAEVDLDNPEGRFRPGMYASVTISVPSPESAMGVPSRAVRGQGDDRYCLVAADGVLHRRPVVVADDDGRRAVIIKGLAAGDRVCEAASPLVIEGTPVDAVIEEPTR
jgi:RND family efflux transporter MFP subunit